MSRRNYYAVTSRDERGRPEDADRNDDVSVCFLSGGVHLPKISAEKQENAKLK